MAASKIEFRSRTDFLTRNFKIWSDLLKNQFSLYNPKLKIILKGLYEK
jgi:hypothetical protein